MVWATNFNEYSETWALKVNQTGLPCIKLFTMSLENRSSLRSRSNRASSTSSSSAARDRTPRGSVSIWRRNSRQRLKSCRNFSPVKKVDWFKISTSHIRPLPATNEGSSWIIWMLALTEAGKIPLWQILETFENQFAEVTPSSSLEKAVVNQHCNKEKLCKVGRAQR